MDSAKTKNKQFTLLTMENISIFNVDGCQKTKLTGKEREELLLRLEQGGCLPV